MSANSRQVAGAHYQADIQHWDYTLGFLDNRYLEGNITKYVCRHRRKNGAQDLHKALHYLDKLEEAFTAGHVRGLDYLPFGPLFSMTDFIEQNSLNESEVFICKRLAYWYRVDHLKSVRKEILKLVEVADAEQARMDAIKAGAEPGRGYVNQG